MDCQARLERRREQERQQRASETVEEREVHLSRRREREGEIEPDTSRVRVKPGSQYDAGASVESRAS